MATQNAPWTTKYAPQHTKELQGQNAALELLRAFVGQHKRGTLCLLHGPQGTGKTSMVHALAHELDAELLEVNASDVRNEESIESILGPALQQRSLFGKQKIILFDEADGISGNSDRGGLAALLRLAKETPYPIILTANDPWHSRFSELRKQALLVPMRTLAYTSIASVLRRIADAEGLAYTDESIKALSRRAGGDLRAAITDLQTLGHDVSAQRIASVSQRDTAASIIDSVRIVLKTKEPATARAALDNLQEDIGEIFLWMDENLPKEYRKPEDIARAYDILSRADVFRGRITRWQHWRFLVYCYDLLGPGIALAKTERYEGFVSISRTQRLLAIWRTKSATRDAIVAKLAAEQHISKRQARKELPLLKPVLRGAGFLSEEERAWTAAR